MNPASVLRVVIYVALLASALLHGSLSAATEERDSDKVFVGYLYRRPSKINFDLYTHLCHAFIVADEEGNIEPRRGIPSRELTEEAHKANVKVLLALGGWGWDKQFASIVSESQREDRYVNSVMKIVEEYNYDGIDLDWEYPDTKEEIVGFERLSRRFRKRLDELGRLKGRPLLQTMAVSANPGTLKWLSNEILLENMDWLHVMTYDFAGSWTSYAGHHSPLHASSRQPVGEPRSTELTIDYLLNVRGLPAHRLAMGIPLYGRGFPASEPYAPKKDGRNVDVPRGNYSNLHALQHEKTWIREWDDETKTPWLIAPDGSVVIGYDDSESVAIKTEWAMQKGLRGIFFWQIGADLLPDGSNPLQESSHKKWEKSRPSAPAPPSVRP